MRPAQFCRQCLQNRERQVQLPHVEQIAPTKPPAKLGRQIFSQRLQQALAILRPVTAALLVLDDVPPNLPIQPDHFGVDRLRHALPRGVNQPAEGLDQVGIA